MSKWPEKKDITCKGHEDNICDCDFSWCDGFNVCLEECKKALDRQDRGGLVELDVDLMIKFLDQYSIKSPLCFDMAQHECMDLATEICSKFGTPPQDRGGLVPLDKEKLAQVLFAYNTLVSGISMETIKHHWDLFPEDMKGRYYSQAKEICSKFGTPSQSEKVVPSVEDIFKLFPTEWPEYKCKIIAQAIHDLINKGNK